MARRATHPQSTLRLVALEIRFPLTSRILTRGLWDALEEALAKDLPNVEVLVEDADSTIPSDPDDAILRRVSRDSRRAVTLYAGAVTIELSDYAGYEKLRVLAEVILNAFWQSGNALQPTRMGLRYINEVKSSSVHGPEDKWQKPQAWEPYINGQLLTQIDDPPESLCAYATRGSIYMHALDGKEQLSVDYGILSNGLLDPDGVLTLDESGPCFVMDIDAYLHILEAEMPTDTQGLLYKLKRLHNVIVAAYQWSITDRTREIFSASQTDEPNDREPLLPASNG